MNMEDVKAALKSLGIDPSFIRHMEITGPAQDPQGQMVLVVKRFAADDKGNRFLVFDGTTGKQEAAAEQHVIPLATFIEALTSCTASPR